MSFYLTSVNFLFTIILISSLNFAQENFRIYPGPVTQTEPVISINSVNPNLIFVSAKTINTSNAFISEGVYVSTNGGLSWSGSDSCKGALIQNHGGSPQIMVNRNGRLILNHIGILFPGIYSHYSDDLGAAWTSAFTISSQQTEDIAGSASIDNSPTSQYYSRLY